jgi:hypothetical protein
MLNDPKYLPNLNLLSTDHEKIPAMSSMYVHAQYFAMSDELLLAIMKTFLQKSEQTTYNMLSGVYVHSTSLNHP